ncbi:metallophosphoesterase [Streptomyces sp. STR69]|uniref:metallophosphoesterase n=1 Tax=Streptomyces sp. STR69 TaxID=1796942 RepID=UPI0021C92B91|nr:metallophosphoesterase [Streptomyces sp. STR69]
MAIVVIALAALVAVAVLGGAHWYVWRRLVRDTTRAWGPARVTGTAVLIAGPVLMIAALAAERGGAPFWLQGVLGWPGFLWMALVIYLLLAVLAGEVLRPLLRRFLARRGRAETVVVEETGSAAPEEPRSAPSRRLFVSRVVGGAAAAAAVGTVGYGTYGVLRGPSVKRVTVPLARLPRSAHGFRIAVVSDIHLGPVLGRGFAQKVVDTINSTQPDLIAVVGDLVDGSVKNLGPAAAPLAQLRARHGSFFVTGNHEYFSGAEQWLEEVRRLDIHTLENARTELPGFDLAGVNDLQGESEGQGPDFGKALGDRDTTRACVLLAHQPVQIHEAVKHGVDLQLSGHTHGGQLWPGNFIAAAANPTVAGLERYGDTELYVSRGAGAWGPPTRVGAPSDITVVELASKQA